MANIDKEYLDERCKQLWGKIDLKDLEFPPIFPRMCRCVDIIDKGITKDDNSQNHNND